MELTQQPPGGQNHVQSVTAAEIRIAGESHCCALLVTADSLIRDWPVAKPEEITSEHLEAILELRPEVVLIGTGKRQVFLRPELLMTFYRNGIGVEMMSTPAACRTFNVLISDNRKVAAALLPPDA
jgi:uncharacterized protein